MFQLFPDPRMLSCEVKEVDVRGLILGTPGRIIVAFLLLPTSVADVAALKLDATEVAVQRFSACSISQPKGITSATLLTCLHDLPQVSPSQLWHGETCDSSRLCFTSTTRISNMFSSVHFKQVTSRTHLTSLIGRKQNCAALLSQLYKGEHDLHGFHCVLMFSLCFRWFVPGKWHLAFWSLRPIPAAYLSVTTIRCEFDFALFMHWLDAQTPQKEMYFNIIQDETYKRFIYYRSWHVLAICGVSMTSRFVDAVQAED